MINSIATPGAAGLKASGQGSAQSDLISMLLGQTAKGQGLKLGQDRGLLGILSGISGQGQAGADGAAETGFDFAGLFESILGAQSAGKSGSSAFGVAVSRDADSGAADQQDAEAGDGTEDQLASLVPAELIAGQAVIPIGSETPAAQDGVGVHVAVPHSTAARLDSQNQAVPVAVRESGPGQETNSRQDTDAGATQAAWQGWGQDTAPAASADPRQQDIRTAAPVRAAVQADTAPGAVQADAKAPRGAARSRTVNADSQSATQDTAQPVRSEFSWMMNDSLRRVVTDTSSAQSAFQAPAKDGDGSDKPVESVAAASPQMDYGVSARLSTSSTARTEAQRAAPEVHQRVIDQVVKEVKLHKLENGSDLTIKLQPAELGSLRIRLVSDAQGVTSQIEASSPQVRNLLQAHVPMLMDQLSSAGVRLDSVSVTSSANLGAWSETMTQQHSQQQTATPQHRHSAGEVVSTALGEQPAAYGVRESTAYSWLA
jgi:flagellar hook-length control protein FliK